MIARPLPAISDEDASRFFENIAVDPSGCWIWGGKSSHGYGRFCYAGDAYRAHRVSYLIAHGSIGTDRVIDHLCRVTRCVNPEHLEVVTAVENTMRGNSPFALKKRQTHCLRGHAFTPENTNVNKRGCRECVACVRAKSLRQWARLSPETKERYRAARRPGTIARSYLTDDQISEIRRLRFGGLRLKEVASRFGISDRHVSTLCVGRDRNRALGVGA